MEEINEDFYDEINSKDSFRYSRSFKIIRLNEKIIDNNSGSCEINALLSKNVDKKYQVSKDLFHKINNNIIVINNLNNPDQLIAEDVRTLNKDCYIAKTYSENMAYLILPPFISISQQEKIIKSFNDQPDKEIFSNKNNKMSLRFCYTLIAYSFDQLMICPYCKGKMFFDRENGDFYICSNHMNNIMVVFRPFDYKKYVYGLSTLVICGKEYGDAIYLGSKSKGYQNQDIDSFIQYTQSKGILFKYYGKNKNPQISVELKNSALDFTPDNYSDKLKTISTFQ